MKRSILALAALAAGATAAHAADSLTVFGGMDGNVTRVSAEGRGHVWQVRDGGMYVSKIGFTGSEDLGGGYRAHFYLESQAASDTGAGVASNTNNLFSGSTTGSGINWNRKATVSLITPMGEVRMGRDYTSTFVPATYFDPFFSAGVASAVNYQPYYKYIGSIGATLAPGTLVRASNMIGYFIPPTWVPGLYLYGQAALSEGTGARYTGIGSGYRRGALFVAAAYGKTRRPLIDTGAYLTAPTASPDNTLTVWSAGASYRLFDTFTLMGFFHSQKLDAYGELGSPIATETDRKVDDYQIGFSWAIGVNTVKAAYMKRNDKGLADADSQQVSLGYSHHLSKRTALYANYVDIRNDHSANYNFLSSGFLPTAGGKASAIQVGLSHSF
ncbi:MAG: porin [Rhizobacter sp.]|nr:porin [Rhizobacter sp.]